jgi:hypothetical protein
MDPITQKFIRQLRSITLSDEERASLRAALIDKMSGSSEAQPIPSPWTQFFYARSVQVAFLSFVIVVGYGSAVTLAAENALPGDPLYPVKTRITEPIARLVTPKTLTAQAGFETGLLNERLKEAEALDSEKKLDAPLQQTVREGIRVQSVKAKTVVRDVVEEDSHTDVPDLTEPARGIGTSSVETAIREDQSTAVRSDQEREHEAERALKGVLEKHKRILEKLDLENGKGNEKGKDND